MAGGVAQVVGYFPNNFEALSLNPSTVLPAPTSNIELWTKPPTLKFPSPNHSTLIGFV
jgi:hypothetical protein